MVSFTVMDNRLTQFWLLESSTVINPELLYCVTFLQVKLDEKTPTDVTFMWNNFWHNLGEHAIT